MQFEHDAQAAEQLERAKPFGRPSSHTVQRQRGEAWEHAVLLTEVDRLRADGLPVLDPDEVRDVHQLRLSVTSASSAASQHARTSGRTFPALRSWWSESGSTRCETLGLDTSSVYGGGRQAAERLADQQATRVDTPDAA